MVPACHSYVIGLLDSEWACDAWTGDLRTDRDSKQVQVELALYPATPLAVRVTRGPDQGEAARQPRRPERGGDQIAPCTIDGVAYDQCTVATQEILDSAGNVVLTHPAGVAFFHPEHNHWHQSAVAAFKITTGDRSSPGGCSQLACGTEIAAGVKITFCFVDVIFAGVTGVEKKALPRTYFECNGDFQGLAVGWGDEYHQSTPLQELEVTGLPEGDYYLTHEADPENHWLEGPAVDSTGELDNFTWVKFRLSRKGANPEVAVIDHSPCIGAQCGLSGSP
jgi:hypothetical protein